MSYSFEVLVFQILLLIHYEHLDTLMQIEIEKC